VILDTNSLSALADGNPDVISALEEASTVAIPVVVLGEYRFGLRRSRYRIESERWLDGFLDQNLVLPVEEETAEHYADIRDDLKRSGRPIPANDVWIAALGKQHRLPILSRDTHFDYVPRVRRVAW
jgi:tRNA(fMet)-specific endonuclease VapC